MIVMIRRACLSLVIATALSLATHSARASEVVDTALVLAVDASGSIDPNEFALQREGIAAAVTSPDLLDLIGFGQYGTIAIAYLEWGGPGMAQVVVSWAFVHDQESAEAFAQQVLSAPRSGQSYNAIGDAIVASQALFESCPCQPLRRVIDVSGDNPDNRSIVPARVARDRAVAEGIIINALAILQDSFVGPSGKPWLVESYEAEVIGGPGAFVMTANSRRDFERALLDKMLLEIAAPESDRGSPSVTDRNGAAAPLSHHEVGTGDLRAGLQ